MEQDQLPQFLVEFNRTHRIRKNHPIKIVPLERVEKIRQEGKPAYHFFQVLEFPTQKVYVRLLRGFKKASCELSEVLRIDLPDIPQELIEVRNGKRSVLDAKQILKDREDDWSEAHELAWRRQKEEMERFVQDLVKEPIVKEDPQRPKMPWDD